MEEYRKGYGYLKECSLPFYQGFFEEIVQKLESGGNCCLIAIDVDHFKLYNDIYGFRKGNSLLLSMEKVLIASGYPAGYMGGDDFAVLAPNDREQIEALQARLDDATRGQSKDLGFASRFGIYVIEDRETDPAYMYDRALLAMQSTKGNYLSRTGWYDGRLREEMEEEHFLLSNILHALENHEFLIYLQPQFALETGKVLGYEALVRWQHPERGMIPPSKFIPVLEKNGLITMLDQQIWRRVAELLHQHIAEGRKAVPISVNVSRMDIYTIDTVRFFTELTDRYGIDRRLLEIEITESTYAENEETIAQVVKRFQEAGFVVLLDDFGSGYSSLNMLRKVNVDIIKIDMRFLSDDEGGLGKTVGILEAIARMARLLNMRMIAEGIETQEQIDYLLRIGCEYGQGFFFSRPLPVQEVLVRYQREEDYDFRGIQLNRNTELQVEELLRGGMFSDWLLEKILGGIAFYLFTVGADIELLRANAAYYRMIQTRSADVLGKHRNIIERVYGEDQAVFQELFVKAMEDHKNGASGKLRYVREDGLIIWLQLRMFWIKEQDGCQIFCAGVNDLQEEEPEK